MSPFPTTFTLRSGGFLPSRRVAFACAMLGGIVYLNALRNPFVYDDHRTIVDNGSIRTLTDLRAIVWHDVTRPLVNFSYAIDRVVWGDAPLGFHVTSVLLHMLNVVLLFVVAWRLVEDGNVTRESTKYEVRSTSLPVQTSDFVLQTSYLRRPQVVAFLAAAFFAVHPMMTEAVGYISGRSEVLCGTFFLLAFLSARRWMRTKGAGWWLLTIALWGAALLTKEIAVMLPVVLLLYDRLFLSPESRTPNVEALNRHEGDKGHKGKTRLSSVSLVSFVLTHRRLLKLHAPLIGLTIAAGTIRLLVFALLERDAFRIEWRGIFDEAIVIWRYVRLLLIPTGQTIYHDVAPLASALDSRGLAAAGAIVLVIALAWWKRRSDPLAAFGVMWFLLLLVPSSLIVVLDQGEGMAEHRVYLASCGMFLAAGSVITSLLARATRVSDRIGLLARAAVAVAILSLSGRTVLRNAVWADPVALWSEAAQKAPGNWVPRNVLGEVLHDAGRHADAIVAYQEALRLHANDQFAYLKLAVCFAETGRVDEARQTLEQLRTREPGSTVASTGFGAVEMIAGRPDRARGYFMETLARDPRDVMALQWLAMLEEESAGNAMQALRRCEEIQELAPGKLSNEDCIRRNRARLAADTSRR